MEEMVLVDSEIVVAPENVLQGASRLSYDQVAVIGMKNGKYEIFSSHSAEQMENMIDDAIDQLYDGELGFDEEA